MQRRSLVSYFETNKGNIFYWISPNSYYLKRSILHLSFLTNHEKIIKKWRGNSKISKYVSSTINNDNNCVTGYEVSGLRQIYFRLKAVWKKHLPNQIGTIFNLPAKQYSWFGPHLIQLGDIDCAGYQKTLNDSHLLLQWWKMFMLKTTWLLLLLQ